MGGILLRLMTFACASRVLEFRVVSSLYMVLQHRTVEHWAFAVLLLLYGLDERAALLHSTKTFE